MSSIKIAGLHWWGHGKKKNMRVKIREQESKTKIREFRLTEAEVKRLVLEHLSDVANVDPEGEIGISYEWVETEGDLKYMTVTVDESTCGKETSQILKDDEK